jgi:HK97 family phage major capsid protein
MARLAEALGGNTTAEIAAGAQMRFLGYPVEITETLPTVSTALDGAVMCLFGNLGQAAALGDRRGMTMKRSTEVKFLEDQIALKGSERFDINVHSVGTASVVGPITALLGNTS